MRHARFPVLHAACMPHQLHSPHFQCTTNFPLIPLYPDAIKSHRCSDAGYKGIKELDGVKLKLRIGTVFERSSTCVSGSFTESVLSDQTAITPLKDHPVLDLY